MSIFVHTRAVYAIDVKNITLSADEHLIERARQTEYKTLNDAFREWLQEYTSRGGDLERFTSSCNGCGARGFRTKVQSRGDE